MKKITAVYFSPCGTTKTAVCSVAAGLGEMAKEADLTPLSAASTEFSLDAEDVLLCGVPSFGGRVPLTALERIKNLHGNGTAAVAVVTYGNRAFDDTFAELQDALEAQGFVVVAGVAAVTQHSIVNQFGAGRPNAEDQTQLQAFGKEIAEKLTGTHIYLDKVSVGATINIMMAASMAEGKTIIENAAKEPHVVDVANFLNSMGAQIRGAGTDVIRIVGVEKLHKTEYSIIPDQIEAGTFMFAAAATKGDVTVKNVIPKHLEATTAKLLEIGCEVEEFDDAVRVVASKPLHHTQVTTLPYPGFPTDMQPQMAVVLGISEGTSTVTESIFENRFKYVDELTRMGANIKVESNIAIINGTEKYTGARVNAPDLRAGAALVIAGLAAEGITVVDDIYYIERGYEEFEAKLASLGAVIEKVSTEKEIQKFTLKVS